MARAGGEQPDEVVEDLHRRVCYARAVLDLDKCEDGALVLREAEVAADHLTSDALGHAAFRAVLDLRDTLGSSLWAAHELEEAGAGNGLVIGVLRRAADTADDILTRALSASCS
jgi:hypothetical protein